MPEKLVEELLGLAHALRSASAVQPALRTVTATASRLSGSDQCTLRLVDPKGNGLLLAARAGRAMHGVGSSRFSVNPDQSLLGWCVSEGRSARVNDVAHDARFHPRDGQTWMPGSVMVAPLRDRTEVIGVISTARKEGTPYEASDLRLLDLIAAMVAPHVEVELLSELAETDPLTLLRNRRHLEKRFPIEFAAALRYGRPLSVIAIDLDRFKRVNDTHGHPVGDEVLIEVGRRMQSACRPADVVARVGGEEFLILLPETDSEAAYTTARRILAALRDVPIKTQACDLRITASAGVCAARPYDDLRALIERVDDLLYQSKEAGRDRVVAELERAS